MNSIFEKLLNNNITPPPVEYQGILNRNKELEADNAGLCKALDEKTRHWEGAVNRAKELEAELVWLHKGNRGLMEELQFLKAKNKELSEIHDDVVLNKWKNRSIKKNVMCKNPFTRIEILENGDVYPCCSAWLKNGFSFGNIYNNDSFDEIWNSENAKKLRYSVTEGDFEYCTKYCLYKNFTNSGSIVSRNLEKYSFKNYQDCYIDTLPTNISLSCDATCNLHCPSCRTHIRVNSEQENNKLSNMLNTIIKPALKDCNFLSLLGSGEILFSKPLGDFCKTIKKQEFPNLKIHIITNGQLLTEEKCKEFENLKGMIGRIAVSVDAVEKQTYETIRMGGKWERLQEAFLIISELKNKKYIENFVLRFVVQKLNYKQIPAFVTMAKNIKADKVEFIRLNNWGTFNTTDFLDMDVMNPMNKHYDEARHLMEEALKEQGIIVTQNCLGTIM